MPWTRFVLFFFLVFVVVHAFFAFLYLLEPNSIQGSEGALNWWTAFCFSVQSLSTIGYGVLHPVGVYANMLVTIEAFVGLLYGAVLTGCFFAKISRPAPQLLFSQQILCYPINDIPHLVLRVANKLDGSLIEVKANVHVRIYDSESKVFRLIKLKLNRDSTPNLSLNWIIFHPIDAESPLDGIPLEEWSKRDIRILVNMTGHDSIYQQLVHDRRIYSVSDVIHNHRFVDMICVKETTLEVDLSKISQIESINDLN